MKKHGEMVGLGMAAAFLLGVGMAGAQPPTGTGDRGPRGADRPARYLELTDQQKEAFAQIREKQRPQIEALRQKMRENHEQLRQALESANPEPVSVGEIAIEGHRLMGQMRALREDADKQLRALLTPEQQVKFDAMKALRSEGGPMGMGPMSDGPMGHGRMGWRGKGAPPENPLDQPPPQD
jgi:Spy/CpxP family protein refolding chaperone